MFKLHVWDGTYTMIDYNLVPDIGVAWSFHVQLLLTHPTSKRYVSNFFILNLKLFSIAWMLNFFFKLLFICKQLVLLKCLSSIWCWKLRRYCRNNMHKIYKLCVWNLMTIIRISLLHVDPSEVSPCILLAKDFHM